MKRYQAALDKGGGSDLLFDAKDDILETMDRLNDVRRKLNRGLFWPLDHTEQGGQVMSKETTIINIRYACLDMANYASDFTSAIQILYRDTVSRPERIADVADYCIKCCDNLIAEMRKQRRVLVRARYELRKEQEK